MILVNKAVCAAPMHAIRARSILARLIATPTESSSLCCRQRLRYVPASKMGTASRRLREDRFLRGCRRQTALDVVAHPRLENADDDLQHTCCGARTYARFLSVDSRLTEFRLTAILLERDVSFEVFPDAEPGQATPAATVKGRSSGARHDTRASQFSTACLAIGTSAHGR